MRVHGDQHRQRPWSRLIGNHADSQRVYERRMYDSGTYNRGSGGSYSSRHGTSAVSGNNNVWVPTCYSCGEHGHKANECPNRQGEIFLTRTRERAKRGVR